MHDYVLGASAAAGALSFLQLRRVKSAQSVNDFAGGVGAARAGEAIARVRS